MSKDDKTISRQEESNHRESMMKKNLMEILVCPICKGEMKLKTKDKNKEDIVQGELVCRICSKSYSISEGIPRLIDASLSGENDKHQEICQANQVYHDMVADYYEQDEALAGSHNQSNQKRIENVVKTISQQSGDEWFLDLACGTGNVLKFGQNCFKNAVGVDISVAMLRIAKQRGLEVIQADIVKLPFRDEVFNSASCFSVLHHLYDQEPFFEETYRVLGRNGILYTDWDPVARPRINENSFKWRLFVTAKQIYKFLVKPLLGRRTDKKAGQLNYRQMNPASYEMYKKAEYHLPSDGEGGDGIDFRKLKNRLLHLGYRQADATFHWNGKKFCQLPVRERLNTRAMQLFGFLPKDFMENVQMIIKK